eukprot:4253804-Karenia_brevis.AAC.2
MAAPTLWHCWLACPAVVSPQDSQTSSIGALVTLTRRARFLQDFNIGRTDTEHHHGGRSSLQADN